MTPSTPIQAQPSGKITPSNVQQTPSQIGTLGVGLSSPYSTSSSDMSNPTLASLRRKRTRILRDIYVQNEGENNAGLTSFFYLYSHLDDPIHFEEEIKEEN